MAFKQLFLVTRPDRAGWDEYDSFVCVAEDAESAKRIHPHDLYVWNGKEWGFYNRWGEWNGGGCFDSWPTPDSLNAEYIGDAKESLNIGDVLCASFNAG